MTKIISVRCWTGRSVSLGRQKCIQIQTTIDSRGHFLLSSFELTWIEVIHGRVEGHLTIFLRKCRPSFNFAIHEVHLYRRYASNVFGEAFELGHHEWFALRRLITHSAFTGALWNSFLKETSKEDGRTKNWTVKSLLHGTLWFRNSPTGEQIQNGRTTDEITRDPITPWCGPPSFCPCFSLAETSVLKIS